jgi:putative transposase
VEDSQVSVGRACRVVSMRRSGWYYKTQKDDRKVIDKLHQYAECHPTRGFDEYYGMIKNEGLKWNRKKVLRIYRNMKLGLRRKRKQRVPARVKQPLQKQQQPNKSYSMDFMSDALVTGRKLRLLNVMDDCTRESLAAYADFSIPAEKMVSVLNEIIDHRGLPEQIRVDNGPEFLSKAFVKWSAQKGIEIKYTQPGKPMQNGYIERLNRTFREDVLDAYEFETLEELRILSDEWQRQYNHYHPHKSLKRKTPAQVFMAFRRESLYKSMIAGYKIKNDNTEQAITNLYREQ